MTLGTAVSCFVRDRSRVADEDPKMKPLLIQFYGFGTPLRNDEQGHADGQHKQQDEGDYQSQQR
jgi:hypothetical protein